MMDSSGLGALLSTMKAAKKAGCKFFLCSAHNQVNMLFELTKMDRVFKVFKSRDEFNAAMLKE
jgi:anti-anti-sigma factor